MNIGVTCTYIHCTVCNSCVVTLFYLLRIVMKYKLVAIYGSKYHLLYIGI